jgi:serine/threonine protein kinase/Tfp pilus assembly protein PilF
MDVHFQFVGHTLGHYRIIERIGAGGMGVVYRAYDELLDRDVALKVLPVGTLTDESARKQFRKEALALAKMNHQNIATIFEFSSQSGVDFLAMEMVPGLTLSARLVGGPLDEEEALKLGMQLADGLAAAHAQGVTHRDLKPGNLMVSPEGRLKILDFGLATMLKSAEEMELTRSVAETSGLSGTLPYISPEQLRGEPADAQSDVYAAGTVLYEMATGRRPFRQPQSAELIGAILHQPPSPPRTHNPLISAAFEGVVMKALEKTPAQRYRTARELLTALEAAGAMAHETARTRQAVSRRRRWWVVASVGALLIAGVILGLNMGGWRDRVWRQSVANRPSFLYGNRARRRSVAVLGLKNLSGRPDESWLSTALAEMLNTELAAGEQLRVISGENVAQMKMNLSLPEEDTYSKATLNRIRRNLSTDDVVTGSYLALGNGRVRVDLRLQDADSGETLVSVAEMGSEAEISDVVARAGQKLRGKLDAGSVSTADARAVRASLPSDPEAARLYSEGLAKLRVFDSPGARDLLMKAVAAEPDFPLAHSELAEAWSGLGYEGKAREEAKEAYGLSGNLNREDRLSIEARYRETTGEWDKAIEIYQTLFSFFPDNLDYGLRLAEAQTSASKGQDALITVEAIRTLPSPASDDPRIDDAEARGALSLGDFQRDKAAAARAAQKGEALGARLLVARARHTECWALHRLGESEQAKQACEQARNIFADAGDRDGVANVLITIAAGLDEQGDYAGAKKNYTEALSIFRQIGDRGSMATALNNTGNLFSEQGDYAAGKRAYAEAVSVSRETDDKDSEVLAQGNLAGVLVLEGDLSQARAMIEDLLRKCREMKSKDRMALQLNNLGYVYYYQGELGAAKKALEESLALNNESGAKRQVSYCLKQMAEIDLAEGDLVNARRKKEEALKIQSELGDKEEMAETSVELAMIAIEEGHTDQAEAPVRKAIAEFQAMKTRDTEVWAQVSLASVLLAAGKLTEAQKEIARNAENARISSNLLVRLRSAIVESRVGAASGETAEAAKVLEAAIAEASKHGFVNYQLEAELALGEIQMKAGQVTSGRTRLGALEKDAAARGFLLIARKAAAAVNGSA